MENQKSNEVINITNDNSIQESCSKESHSLLNHKHSRKNSNSNKNQTKNKHKINLGKPAKLKNKIKRRRFINPSVKKLEKNKKQENKCEDLKFELVKKFIDDVYIKDYTPDIQNHKLYPKLDFYIDCNSVSESDKELSSASLSVESKNDLHDPKDEKL